MRKKWREDYKLRMSGAPKSQSPKEDFNFKVKQRKKIDDLDAAELAIFTKMKAKNKVIFKKEEKPDPEEPKPIVNLAKQKWIDEMKKLQAEMNQAKPIAKPPAVDKKDVLKWNSSMEKLPEKPAENKQDF